MIIKLDNQDYIPVLENQAYQSEFQSIMTETVIELSNVLKEGLHSIYV